MTGDVARTAAVRLKASDIKGWRAEPGTRHYVAFAQRRQGPRGEQAREGETRGGGSGGGGRGRGRDREGGENETSFLELTKF